jgi:hypothetical protein
VQLFKQYILAKQGETIRKNAAKLQGHEPLKRQKRSQWDMFYPTKPQGGV